MLSDPIISIIIPCYNHGLYIQEAIDSVLPLKNISYEIIIVNDGSTDEYTLQKLGELKLNGYNVISHENHGLGYTRNVGIKNAKGKYILPLDADNKINVEYIKKAIPILEKGIFQVVYAKPIFFGEVMEHRIFITTEFNEDKLILGNFIDACAIFNKTVWIKNNGYDTNMPFQGNEDWEFWVNSLINGFNFYFLNEELFYYRIVKGSMFDLIFLNDKEKNNYDYIIKKHSRYYSNKISQYYSYKSIMQYEIKHPARTMIKYLLKILRLKR